MQKDKNDLLNVKEYLLESSSDVEKTVSDIAEIDCNQMLIHIYSIIHNTVLVQNLKQELSKRVGHANVVLLKHNDRNNTRIVIYSYYGEVFEDNLESEILNDVNLKNTKLIRKLQECKTEFMSRYFTDHLTRLPNLYQLRKDLSDNEKSALVSIVVDDFVTINNFYGFIVGDYVLEQVGKFLIENLDDKVYRVSGTEFAVNINKELNFYELKEYMSNMYKKIKIIQVEYQNSRITTSLTLASSASSSNENVFAKVSMALKYAQENHLPFWIYEDSMRFENEYEQNLSVSSKVRHAVQNSKIVPYFQPIFDNKTEKIVKYECLARLLDESDNVISPALFLPLAKKVKVYNLITKIIIEKSFEAFKDNDYDFSINLSIDDVMSTDIFEFIIDTLKNSPIANRVIFEIVESEAIVDFTKVSKFINEIKRYGAKVAIDDFGDGYSNFSYLIKMDVDYIKIDGSLIKDIDVDKSSLMVVETIVDFARKLGVKTIAEYVHSSTVLDKVKELGIDFSQGFYIDKPSLNIM
ncbi:EAL domain-containing protein [Sulfurimonas lithotrophica]|uniref:EAL domain-containing protein n=1 Tax=Sulfurimonas lithotrophica TaxID=2590022 RepID=A0A5P8P0E2_9BACT|nr:GGDEF domain-containing phosphodiesterase [Sulfurimonas lithotrophica]QFR49178.1 EAL domain-containing protein [Sulfurimonas lithotrophica]